jgi:adenylate cyclase
MRPSRPIINMPSNTPTDPWPMPELTRVRRIVVVVDVVESVRVMQEDEAGFIERWRRFVHHVRTELLPKHGGRLVKSLGDGMLLEFEDPRAATACALEQQRHMSSINSGVPTGLMIWLRIGLHVADVVVDDIDVLGSGVNLAARLATLAEPGETVASVELRDALSDGVDASFEDLGEQWLKHLQGSVRAYRVHAPESGGLRLYQRGSNDATALQPGIAVMPLAVHFNAAEERWLGEAVADRLTAALSRFSALRVVSRLSTSACAGRSLDPAELRQQLGVPYIVSGRCQVIGTRARLQLELCDARDGSVLWADGRTLPTQQALLEADDLVHELVAAVGATVVEHELRRATSQPLPTLESYALLLAAITLMHRQSPQAFDRSHAMLSHLVERHPRLAAPRAWLGKWHVLRVAQGWSGDAPREAQQAHAVVARALEAEPDHPLALAVDGLVCAYVQRDLKAAGERYDQALDASPSESLAWLFKSALHAYNGEGAQAGKAADRALSLSPLDPMRYYYLTFAATAQLAAGDYGRALTLAQQSVRANRTHVPAFRNLAIAQVLSGDEASAQTTIRELLQLEPTSTVSAFRARYPGRDSSQIDRFAHALSTAGLPA